MSQITFPVLDNSQLEQQGASTSITAGLVMENIDTVSSNDSALLVRARDEFASQYPSFPGYDTYKLTRLVLKPFNTNTLVGIAVYETGHFDQVSSFIIRFTGFTTRQETNLVPGSRVPISVGWEGGTETIFDKDGNPSSFTPKVADDLVTMGFMMPVLTVSISGLVYGTPDTGYQDGVAYVNNAIWPTGLTNLIKPKDVGYWMIQKYETAIAKYKGYYTYEALASSRVFADWSETGVMVNRQTGRHVKVSDATIAAANALPYAYGIIYPTDPTNKPGFVRVGGNPVLSFPSIFGF